MHMHVSEIATQLPGIIINGGGAGLVRWGSMGLIPHSNSLEHSSWNKVREDLLGGKKLWKLAKYQILG